MSKEIITSDQLVTKVSEDTEFPKTIGSKQRRKNNNGFVHDCEESNCGLNPREEKIIG